MKKYYQWFKIAPDNETMVEVTKNYFSDGDEFINEENGWTKTSNHIEVKDEHQN